MSKQDNIRAAEQTLAVMNSHDLTRDLEIYADNYQFDGPGASGTMTYEQSQAYLQGFIDAFPDLHFEINRTIADEDSVVLNWTAVGTHSGALPTPSGNSIPPTGKTSKVYGSTTYHFKNGKISHGWTYWDMASLLAQLGLLPPM